MITHIKKSRVCIKVISLTIACLFLVNNIIWADTGTNTLSPQHIFNPLKDEEVQDIGFLKAAFKYNLIQNENFLDNSKNKAIKIENNPVFHTVEFKFAQKEIIRNSGYLVPCVINRSKTYYAYVAQSPQNPDRFSITIYTKADYDKGMKIKHQKRPYGQDEKMVAESAKKAQKQLKPADIAIADIKLDAPTKSVSGGGMYDAAKTKSGPRVYWTEKRISKMLKRLYRLYNYDRDLLREKGITTFRLYLAREHEKMLWAITNRFIKTVGADVYSKLGKKREEILDYYLGMAGIEPDETVERLTNEVLNELASQKEPDSASQRQALLKALTSVLPTLTYREREIILREYGILGREKYSRKETAKIFKLSKQRVSKILEGAIRKLQRAARRQIILNEFEEYDVSKPVTLKLASSRKKMQHLKVLPDITIADIGVETAEHEGVINRRIRELISIGHETVTYAAGPFANFRIHIIGDKIHMYIDKKTKQRAHAGGISTVGTGHERGDVWITKGYYDNHPEEAVRLLRHEAHELGYWWAKTLQLLSGGQISVVEVGGVRRNTMREWIRDNIDEARALQKQYHIEAENACARKDVIGLIRHAPGDTPFLNEIAAMLENYHARVERIKDIPGDYKSEITYHLHLTKDGYPRSVDNVVLSLPNDGDAHPYTSIYLIHELIKFGIVNELVAVNTPTNPKSISVDDIHILREEYADFEASLRTCERAEELHLYNREYDISALKFFVTGSRIMNQGLFYRILNTLPTKKLKMDFTRDMALCMTMQSLNQGPRYILDELRSQYQSDVYAYVARNQTDVIAGAINHFLELRQDAIDGTGDQDTLLKTISIFIGTLQQDEEDGEGPDITIADIGVEAADHEGVINRRIRELINRGHEISTPGTGPLAGFRVHIVGNKTDMYIDKKTKQRAHAGGISTVGTDHEKKDLWITKGYYDSHPDESEWLLRHEAHELERWLAKTEQLLTEGHISIVEEGGVRRNTVRRWIRDNIDEARALQKQYHIEAQNACVRDDIIDLLESAFTDMPVFDDAAAILENYNVRIEKTEDVSGDHPVTITYRLDLTEDGYPRSVDNVVLSLSDDEDTDPDIRGYGAYAPMYIVHELIKFGIITELVASNTTATPKAISVADMHILEEGYADFEAYLRICERVGDIGEYNISALNFFATGSKIMNQGLFYRILNTLPTKKLKMDFTRDMALCMTMQSLNQSVSDVFEQLSSQYQMDVYAYVADNQSTDAVAGGMRRFLELRQDAINGTGNQDTLTNIIGIFLGTLQQDEEGDEGPDITIADVGVEAGEHEGVVNRSIRELVSRGDETIQVKGLEGFEIHVIGNKSDMFIDEETGQRAHAGGISTVGGKNEVKRLWITRGYYEKERGHAVNRLHHEAVELDLWCKKTKELLGKREIRAPDDTRSTLPTIREWIAKTMYLARMYQEEYHNTADESYPLESSETNDRGRYSAAVEDLKAALERNGMGDSVELILKHGVDYDEFFIERLGGYRTVIMTIRKAIQFTNEGMNPYYFLSNPWTFFNKDLSKITAAKVEAERWKSLAGCNARNRFVLQHRPLNLKYDMHGGVNANTLDPQSYDNGPSVEELDKWIKDYVLPYYQGPLYFMTACDDPVLYYSGLEENGFEKVYHGEGAGSDGEPWITDVYKKEVGQPLAPGKAPARRIKCIVVDGDNTLWGGIIDEIGRENVRIGGRGPAEAYELFQCWLKELKEKHGVMLALCTRNSPEDVRWVLRDHPGMILKESDFVAISANYGDKADNIRAIAEKIGNLGPESLVFIDDDPRQRMRVSAEHPAVATMEFSDEPRRLGALMDAVEAICPKTAPTASDKARTGYIKEVLTERDALRKTSGTDKEFYSKLGMRITVYPAAENNIPRLAQLTQRTNQFNLTAARYTDKEIYGYINNPNYRVYCLEYADRFGDAGDVVGLIILKNEGKGTWAIDTFCMSCRILDLTVENAFITSVVSILKDEKAKALIGRYVPTDRNTKYKTVYGSLGFKAAGKAVGTQKGAGAVEQWELGLAQPPMKAPLWIKVVEKAKWQKEIKNIQSHSAVADIGSKSVTLPSKEEAPTPKDKGSVANCIKDMHNIGSPITAEELERVRQGSATTVRTELEMLKALNLLIIEGRGVKGDPYKYALHPMLKALSREQIDSICAIEIKLNDKMVNILDRYEIPGNLIPQVQSKIMETFQNIIHEENLDLTPAIPQGKTLWHVVVNELIPEDQQGMGLITQINQSSKRAESSEKIKILNKKEKLEDVLAELSRDPNNIVHVALNDETKVKDMPKGVRMIVFKGELGNYIQLEGMMAVSRALSIEDIVVRNNKLLRMYKVLTGEVFSGKLPATDDPQQLALSIIFNLPKIIITDYNELKRLNNILKMLIQAA